MIFFMKEATISLYQDTRRELENGDYPIKLRVYFHRTKLYDTGISMSKDEFKHAYLRCWIYRTETPNHRIIKPCAVIILLT